MTKIGQGRDCQSIRNTSRAVYYKDSKDWNERNVMNIVVCSRGGGLICLKPLKAAQMLSAARIFRPEFVGLFHDVIEKYFHCELENEIVSISW